MCNRRFGVSVNLEKNGQQRTDINDEKGVAIYRLFISAGIRVEPIMRQREKDIS